MRLPTLPLLLALASGCATYTTRYEVGPAAGPAPPQPRAADLGRCPFGHAALRDVPILYGLLAWTPELRRAVDALEVWPGGCVRGVATNMVVCAQCRYTLVPHVEPSTAAATVEWEKDAGSREAFLRPLARWAAEFPVPAASPSRTLHFSQRVNAGGDVVSERVLYWTSEPQVDVAARVVAHLEASGMTCARTAGRSGNRNRVTLDATAAARSVRADLRPDGVAVGQTRVDAESTERPGGRPPGRE